MKKTTIRLWAQFVVIMALLFINVVYVPYYVAEDGKFMAIFDTDLRIFASGVIVALFTLVVYIVYFLIERYRKHWFQNENVVSSVKIFPLVPIVMLLTNYIFNLFTPRSESYYRNLGLDLVNANTDQYNMNVVVTLDLEQIGESLTRGIGFYMMFFLIGLLFYQYYYYSKKVVK